ANTDLAARALEPFVSTIDDLAALVGRITAFPADIGALELAALRISRRRNVDDIAVVTRVGCGRRGRGVAAVARVRRRGIGSGRRPLDDLRFIAPAARTTDQRRQKRRAESQDPDRSAVGASESSVHAVNG